MNCNYMMAIAVALIAVRGAFAADWTIADGKMSDGSWTFEAGLGGESVAVGKCVAAPEKPTALDFSKGVSANGASVKIISLDPRFGYRGPDTEWACVAGKFAASVGPLALPASLEEVGELAFTCCSNATGKIVLPSALRKVAMGAFQNCVGLEFAGDGFPASLKTISGGAFSGVRIAGVLDLSGVTDVEAGAFARAKVESAKFGPELKTIGGGWGRGVFADSATIKNIKLNPRANVKMDAGIQFHDCRKLGLVVDLRAISVLTKSAWPPFQGCPNVKKVFFGTNLTEIASGIFDDASGLEEIHFIGKPPKFTAPVLPQIVNPMPCQPKPLAITTYVHLDPKASDYAEAKAAWDALTAGGELKTSGSTWNEAMGGPDFAKRELVLFKRPTVSIVAENDADEGKGTDGFFTVSRADGDPMTMPLTFRFETSGTAKPGWTYCSLWGDETIPAGEKSVKIRIIPLDDKEMSEDASVTLSLAAYAGGYAIDPAKKSATIKVVNGEKFGGYNTRDAGPWNFIAHAQNSKAKLADAVDGGFAYEADVQITEDGRFYLDHDKKGDITGKATLNDAFDMLKPGMVFKVDCKCGKDGLARMLEEINKTGIVKKGGKLAFNFWGKDECKEVVRAAPGVEAWMPIMHYPDKTYPDLVKEADRIAAWAKDCDCKGISIMWDDRTCTKEMFDRLNAAGITIDVWTLDDVRTLKKAVNYGARWVTTNVPRRMSEELPPANPLEAK